MPKPLDEKFVRRAIVEYLARKGWGRNLREKTTSEQGVDISVWHNQYQRRWLVETKGDSKAKIKAPRSRQEVNFNIALGQILTRMKVEKGKKHYKYTRKYGIGFPESYSKIIFRRLPWAICDVLNLHVFLVDSVGKVKYYNWYNLKKIQKQLPNKN